MDGVAYFRCKGFIRFIKQPHEGLTDGGSFDDDVSVCTCSKCGTYEDSSSENTLLYPSTLSKEKNNALERSSAIRLDKSWNKSERQRNCQNPGIN